MLNVVNKTKIFKIAASATAAFSIVLILINSKTISNSVLNSLLICINVLIPSIFIFLIISNFCQETNVLKFVLKPFDPVFKKLFKTNKNLTSTIFFSLICGYPTGAYLISNLLENEQISKKTATRLLCFCVNSGPAFLIGAISVPFTGNIVIGMILFISQTIAFFVVGTLCSFNAKVENVNFSNNKAGFLKNKKTISQIFVNSINRAIKTMAIICGFTILFSAIIGLVLQLTSFDFKNDEIFRAIVSGFFEVTNGITVFSEIKNLKTLLTLALISSFGGLCVHCQLKAILSKFEISFRKFYAWRIIYCMVSLIACYVLFKTWPLHIATFSISKIKPGISTNGIVPSIGLIILSIALLYCDKKSTIIKEIKNESDENF